MKLITDKLKAMDALKRSVTGQALRNLSPELRDDYDIVMEALNASGNALQYASERLRNNIEIATKAVVKNQLALKHVGDELKNNKEFILGVVEPHSTSWEVFKMCSPELQKDKSFAINFVKKNAYGIKCMSAEFKGDRDIAMAALGQNLYAFQHIKKELRDDFEITKKALKDCHNFRFIAKKHKSDENLVMLAINSFDGRGDFSDLQLMSPELKNNKRFFKQIISKHPNLFQHASDNLKEDGELIKYVLDKIGHRIENHTNDATTSKELLAPYIKQYAYYLKFAPESVLNDREIILHVIKNDPDNIKYASEEIKNMIGSDRMQHVPRLEKIISIESLAEKLDSSLSNKTLKTTVKI